MSRHAIAVAMGLLIFAAGCATPKGTTGDEKRAYVLKMRDDTLNELYKNKPETKSEVAAAPAYAVFSNIGTGFLILGAGNGYGVVVQKDATNPVYMKMLQVSVGLGVGLRDFRAVFIFDTPQTAQKFVNEGWQFGAEADAGVKAGDKGGAVGDAGATGPIKVYQFTENGIVLRASLPLTKYRKYDELNQ